MGQPTEKCLRYSLTRNNTDEQVSYIDLAKDISLLNNRLYRQGRMYGIKRMTLQSSNTPKGYISVGIVPNTWPSHAAWLRARSLWNMVNKQATDAVPEIKLPKWHDFKVHMDNAHRSAGSLVPVDGNGNLADVSNAEWVYSTFVGTDGNTADEFTSHMLGADVGSSGSFTTVGIVQGFEDVKAALNKPAVPGELSTTWMTNLIEHDGSFDDIVDNLEKENDNPPYQFDEFVGAGTLSHPLTIAHGSINTMTGGLEPTFHNLKIPLGLVQIRHQSDAGGPDVMHLLIEMQKGAYKGIQSWGMG